MLRFGLPTSIASPAVIAAVIAALIVNGCDHHDDPRETQLPSQIETAPTDAAEQVAAAPIDPAPVDPAKLRNDAVEAMGWGEVEVADRLIRASIAAEPDHPQSIYLMALVLAEQHRYPEAIRMLDGLAEVVPATRLQVLGQTAEWMVMHGQWIDAEQRFRTLLDAAPHVLAVHRQLAQLLIRQGRRQEAAALLHQMCRQGDIEEAELRSLLITNHLFASDATFVDFDPIGALGKARFAISQGEWDSAIEALDRENPESPAVTALRGRIYAQQRDFESLNQWVADSSPATEATADHWFAMGCYQAQRGDHSAAVRCFCETVIRDQTDKQAYSLMSQSLEKLGAADEASEASQRAELIDQTQRIGKEMAGKDSRDLQQMSKLIGHLDDLNRPFEALAWRAVQLVYASSAMPEAEARQRLEEINQQRLQRLQTNQPDATEDFILCGVDLASMSGSDEAKDRADSQP